MYYGVQVLFEPPVVMSCFNEVEGKTAFGYVVL
jgi:hypothetical protein